MTTKLTTLAQVALLHKGDIIKRFPSNCDDLPQDKFDEQRIKHIDNYEIQSIDPETDMFSLVSAKLLTQMFVSPKDIGRMFINSDSLVAEKVWWV
jgi:hypothetical protein